MDYKDPIVYLRYVFVWERPVDFGLFLTLVTFAFRFYYSTETTVVSMIGSSIVAWAIGSFLTMTANFKVPWASLVPPQKSQEATGNPVDYYGEVIGFFVSLKYALVDFFEHLARIRSTNPTSFIVETTLFGALLAFVGSYVSGQFLFFISFYATLLLPGIIANKIPSKVYVALEPSLHAYLENCKYYAQQGLQQVQSLVKSILQKVQQRQQKQQRQQSPQSPPRGASLKKEPSFPNEQELVNMNKNVTQQEPPTQQPQQEQQQQQQQTPQQESLVSL